MFRKFTVLYLVFYLIVPTGWGGQQVLASPAQTAALPSLDLQKIAEMSYLDIVERADQFKISPAQLEALTQRFKKEKEAERERLKAQIKSLEARQKTLQKQLDDLNKQASRDTPEMAERRKDLHCTIVKIEKEIADAKIRRETTLEVEYENKTAKLELAHRWPEEQREIRRQVEAGTARQRPFGNVDDIGVRVIREGQGDDIKRGQDAIQELKQLGLMPPALEDQTVKDYMNQLGKKISINTDLKVPLQLTVLDSEEINAFALPGGFLFINSGLILRAESESELAGVMAHEIGHVTARHSARLMKKATIASILYQSAQLAALIFTGGAVSLLTYYALQYGFTALGLVISLTLLGVSREYELEADQLGVQYVWKSGYDPKGFITFFDKMASEKGYVRSTSFFRTHPAFADRIIRSFREITFLPPKEEYVMDSPEFRQAHDHLKKMTEELKKKEPAERPTLRRKRIDIECPQEPEAGRPPGNP
ncbi:MAG: M48 family metalloprotease [Acidobacteria bacterium]|nr:M48 family metalloprotease [Acidobacteriota bacterium]